MAVGTCIRIPGCGRGGHGSRAINEVGCGSIAPGERVTIGALRWNMTDATSITSAEDGVLGRGPTELAVAVTAAAVVVATIRSTSSSVVVAATVVVGGLSRATEGL